MTNRWPIALLALAGISAMIFADLASSEPPNIYRQPAAVALGSGQASGGAHCAALPQ